MRKAVGSGVVCAVVVATSTVAHANGLAQLRTFNDATKSGKVTFEQSVVGKGQTVAKQSNGTFSFQRPGKFRWTYEKPIAQVIVGDGEKLWIYDKDLNQVIVRKLDRALGSTPAALLAGGGTLESNFELTDGGTKDGLEYVDAKPKTPDTGFESVRIGLAGNAPRAMELRDTFGNVTTLRFGAFERNVAQDPNVFRFTPPAGADVVGEK
jgi:outer membrane lipoprotein carrier protein